MEITDFLTILGLGLAVWALIEKKERNFILLFFSQKQIYLFIFSLIFLHFLFAFDWLYINWFDWLGIFTVQKGIPSNTWAYIFGLFILTVPIVIVSFGFFHSSRRKELIELYSYLIKSNNIDLLVEYLNKYHVIDLQQFLKGVSNLPEKDFSKFMFRRRGVKEKQYEELIAPKRMRFAADIYNQIIQDEKFIAYAASNYPELFSTIFMGMEKERAANENLVKSYLENLFKTQNNQFIYELQLLHQSNSSIEGRFESYDIPILYSVLSKTNVAAKNNVWYPIGELTIKSLKYDEEQVNFLQQKYDFDLESERWHCKAFLGIVFFNYMVRESIYKNSGMHMWLFYYSRFVENLVNIIPTENTYNLDAEKPSFAHSLITDQFDNMKGWLELASDQKVEYRVIDTIRCMGSCLSIICEADNRKFSSEFLESEIKSIIGKWFHFQEDNDNDSAKLAANWLTKMFLNPRYVDQDEPDSSLTYQALLKNAGTNFDKIPYSMHGQQDLLDKFSNEIISKLK